MSRTKKDSAAREAMCARFVMAMHQLNLSPQELSRALGYTNAATIAKVQRGEAFVDIERLNILAKLETPEGKNIDLNWLISGNKGNEERIMSLNEIYEHEDFASPNCSSNTKNNPEIEGVKLVRVANQSYGLTGTPNSLIFGDNLAVLEYLSASQPESVKCAYLDPPYNNGESYVHYHDDMGHEEWLNAITERLLLVKRLLRGDGCVWISIDDSELHYLKVAADRVFGRDNFIGTIIWERRTTRENRKALSINHEYLLLYAKNASTWTKKRNTLPLTEEVMDRYKNPDADPRGNWQSVSANVQDGHATPQQFYGLRAPNGTIHWPPKGRCWAYSESKMTDEIKKNNIWFGKDGFGVPRTKKFLSDRKDGLTPETLWRAEDVGTTGIAKKQLLSLFRETTLFDTPKPEQLIYKILHISTNPGDLVLDPYLGSGTTAAVAHKMQRSYIGIEHGDHIKSHCALRLQQVIDGEKGGVSAVCNWAGGGGFDFYKFQKKGQKN